MNIESSFYSSEEEIDPISIYITVIGEAISNKQLLINKYLSINTSNQPLDSYFEDTKIVQLSSKNEVNIHLQILPSEIKNDLIQLSNKLNDNPTKAILFIFNLCSKPSLHSIKKWYKECSKCMAKKFISILIGTNYSQFSQSTIEYQNAIIDQSRKYARKMKATLIYTCADQNINVQETFLILLSRIFMFDSQIDSNSDQNFPLIELYHHSKAKSAPASAHSESDTPLNTTKNLSIVANKNLKPRSKSKAYENFRSHLRQSESRSSMCDMQNRLQLIKQKLTPNPNVSRMSRKTRNFHKSMGNASDFQEPNPQISHLFQQFHSQFESFMSKSKTMADSVSPKNTKSDFEPNLQKRMRHQRSATASMVDYKSNPAMYPSFMTYKHLSSSNSKNTKTLPFLTPPNSKTEPFSSPSSTDELRKKRKHARAMSISVAIKQTQIKKLSFVERLEGKEQLPEVVMDLHRRRTTSNAKHHKQPSMPLFLNKLKNDPQLRNIINGVFSNNTQSQAYNYRHSINIPGTFASMPSTKHGRYQTVTFADAKPSKKKKKIKVLKNKISYLENCITNYEDLMHDNRETIGILRQTIQKIRLQKNDAEQKMETLIINTTPTPISAVNGERQQKKIAQNKEIIRLKKKNQELTNLANALAINLSRKEQSLEEALCAVDAMLVQKQDLYALEMQSQSRTSESSYIIERPQRRSLTEIDMLNISHSNIKNIYLGSQFPDDNQNIGFASDSEMNSNSNQKNVRKSKKKKSKKSFKNLFKFTKTPNDI